METSSIFDPWDLAGKTGRIECARPLWEEIAGFAMQGFQRSPSGGPEVGGILFGHRTPGCVQIEAWREIVCEHAGGPFFQLSEQEEEALHLLVETSNGLKVVGWFQSKYWDVRWSQSQNWDFSLTPTDIDLHTRHFPEAWQVVLIIQRTKSGPKKAGFFFRKEDGSLDSVARNFTEVGAVQPVASDASPPVQTIDRLKAAPSVAQPAATVEISSVQETSANSPAPGTGLGRNENDFQDSVAHGFREVATVQSGPFPERDTPPWSESEAINMAIEPPSVSEPTAPAEIISTQTTANSPERAAISDREENAPESMTHNFTAAVETTEAAASSDKAAPTASEPTLQTVDLVREPLNVLQSTALTEIVSIPAEPANSSEHAASLGLEQNRFESKSDELRTYWSPQQRQIFTELISHVENRGGIAVLTGEAGTGKTTVMMRLGDRLDEVGVEFGLVLNSRVTAKQFYEMLAYDFALEASDGSRLAVLSELRKLAIKQANMGRATALLIDEAHNLQADVMEEVRLLDNLYFRNVKLLQIVLAGPPKLDVALGARELSKLRQQVSLRCTLGALSQVETGRFIAQKLALAGEPSQCVFPPEVGREIHNLSLGFPRVIETLCDNLLKTCCETRSKMATLEMLDKVSGQLQLRSSTETGSALRFQKG